jgi:hypothetical protein
MSGVQRPQCFSGSAVLARYRSIDIQTKIWTLRAGITRTNGPSEHHLVGAVSYRTVFWVVARPCGTMPHLLSARRGDAHQPMGRIQIMF